MLFYMALGLTLVSIIIMEIMAGYMGSLGNPNPTSHKNILLGSVVVGFGTVIVMSGMVDIVRSIVSLF